MKHFVLLLLVIGLIIGLAVATYADNVTIQRGAYGSVRDAGLRSDGAPDGNIGTTSGAGAGRLYPDAGAPGDKGPRHVIIAFDLSLIPTNAVINSATYGVYLTEYNGGTTITDYKLSRVQNGKAWNEGSGAYPVASTGDVTWNSQQHGVAAWATAGATGGADIDLGTSQTWGIAAFSGTGFRTFNVASWVQDWVSGAQQNNGMLMWGGIGTGSGNYYWAAMSEEATVANRPYLTIDYTVPPPVIPEPSSLLALLTGASGLGLIWRRRRA
ncbi:MAG: DNRLRE domain-containing protein [Armatimonadota bacterium]|nr:DNRLRE domain-containing protein [Armatimonadota bacterium]